MISTSDINNFKSETLTRHKEGQYIMIKGSIHRGGIVAVNTLYAPSIRAPKNIKQTLTELQEETDSNAIIREFNTPLEIMDRTSKLKINKKTEDLNYTVD